MLCDPGHQARAIVRRIAALDDPAVQKCEDDQAGEEFHGMGQNTFMAMMTATMSARVATAATP